MIKRSLFKLLFVALFLVLLISLGGCTKKENINDDIDIEVVYNLLKESGYTGTTLELKKLIGKDNGYVKVVEKGYTGSELDWFKTILLI